MHRYITSGESVQLFLVSLSRFSRLIYPENNWRTISPCLVPRIIVKQARLPRAPSRGLCAHKCAAIHRNLCYIANRILFSPYSSSSFSFHFFPLLLREQYLGSDENRLHASASRSLSSVKAILEITNNLSAVCLSLYFHFGILPLRSLGEKNRSVVRCLHARCPRSEMIFIDGKTARLIPDEKLCPALSIFVSRTNGKRGGSVK